MEDADRVAELTEQLEDAQRLLREMRDSRDRVTRQLGEKASQLIDAQRALGETGRQLQAADRDIQKLLASRNTGYDERNRMVALVSKVWPSHIVMHPAEDKEWEADWRTIACVHIPGEEGMVVSTWHFHDSDRHLLAHLEGREIPSCPGWQGETTEAKYARLAAYPDTSKAPKGSPSPMRLHAGNDRLVRADRWNRGTSDLWMRTDAAGVPVATLRVIGWIDQKGRTYPPRVGLPGPSFDGGSLTPLLIDAREDGH